MNCKFIPSACPYCGTGCGIIWQVVDGDLVGAMPLKSHPVNQGGLCIKGWNAHEHIMSDMRLRHPLIRRDGRLQRVDWETAIQTAAEGLQAVVERHGPDSVGLLVSAKMTNEENYLAQKFARATVGTNNVDHCARL